MPAAASLLLVSLSWRATACVIGGLGGVVAMVAAAAMPRTPAVVAADKPDNLAGAAGGFALLLLIGMFDTATRMGYLLFLPFLLQHEGGGGPVTGLAFALLFAGGAAGKFACGWLGGRYGLLVTVAVTEGATAALILLTIGTPLAATMCVLPVLGLMLNGTSSVLYGSVPQLARDGEAGRAFALFYTGVIGAGALAPIAYGALGDHVGQTVAIVASALTALATLPLAVELTRRMRSAHRTGPGRP